MKLRVKYCGLRVLNLQNPKERCLEGFIITQHNTHTHTINNKLIPGIPRVCVCVRARMLLIMERRSVGTKCKQTVYSID